VSQGKTTIPGVDDAEEMTLTDVRAKISWGISLTLSTIHDLKSFSLHTSLLKNRIEIYERNMTRILRENSSDSLFSIVFIDPH
jgi:hypothetical protein